MRRFLDPAVAVVVRIDRRVPLVVGAERAEDELTRRRDDVGQGRRRERGLAGRRLEDKFTGGLMQPEAQRLADPAVEVLEADEGVGHRVADPVVVVDVVLPGRLGVRRKAALAIPAMIAGSGTEFSRGRLVHAVGEVDHAHRVFDGEALNSARLMVLLGPADARKDQAADRAPDGSD